MKKIIKKSNRGLTFSFEGKSTNFNIGDKYRYIIDSKSNKVYIVPSSNEKSLTISKKRVGSTIKSLVDLRSKSVLKAFDDAELLEVNISDKIITISILKEDLKTSVVSSITNCVSSKNVINISNRLENIRKIEEIKIDISFLNAVAGDISYNPTKLILDDVITNNFISTEQEIEHVTEGINTTIKVLSVFSGAGMFDFGLFLDNDFEIIKAIEYNEDACASYRENIGNIVVQKDIRDYSIDGEFDLLWGGPPCTPFSNSNRKTRLDKHEDIDLIQEYIRLLKSYKNFKAFVIENVPQFMFRISSIKKQLPDYDINYVILQDNECGGYTTRKRLFVFGSKIGKVIINRIKKVGKTVGDALKKVTPKWFNYNDISKSSQYTKQRMSNVPCGGNWQDIPQSLWQPSYKLGKTHSNTFRRLSMNEPCVTLANFRKCNLIHPIENRGLTVAEASAISGFDERFKFLGTLAAKQLQVSNGVPFNLGVTVKNIIRNLFLNYYNKICKFNY